MAKHIKKSSGRKNPQVHDECTTYNTPAEMQLMKLDARLGTGRGAVKERKRLQKIIDGEK